MPNREATPGTHTEGQPGIPAEQKIDNPVGVALLINKQYYPWMIGYEQKNGSIFSPNEALDITHQVFHRINLLGVGRERDIQVVTDDNSTSVQITFRGGPEKPFNFTIIRIPNDGSTKSLKDLREITSPIWRVKSEKGTFITGAEHDKALRGLGSAMIPLTGEVVHEGDEQTGLTRQSDAEMYSLTRTHPGDRWQRKTLNSVADIATFFVGIQVMPDIIDANVQRIRDWIEAQNFTHEQISDNRAAELLKNVPEDLQDMAKEFLESHNVEPTGEDYRPSVVLGALLTLQNAEQERGRTARTRENDEVNREKLKVKKDAYQTNMDLMSIRIKELVAPVLKTFATFIGDVIPEVLREFASASTENYQKFMEDLAKRDGKLVIPWTLGTLSGVGIVTYELIVGSSLWGGSIWAPLLLSPARFVAGGALKLGWDKYPTNWFPKNKVGKSSPSSASSLPNLNRSSPPARPESTFRPPFIPPRPGDRK